MNNSVTVALQVLITAQVFLLGLAAAQFANEVAGRLRQQLDEVRSEIQGAPGMEFSNDTADRLSRAAALIGGELEDFESRLIPRSLAPQLAISMIVSAVVFGTLLSSANARHIPIVGNPFSNPIYTGGYGVLLAALIGPASVAVQIWSSRLFVLELRDGVLVSAIDIPEARIIVAAGISEKREREAIESVFQSTEVSFKYRSSGDPLASVVACEIIHRAVMRCRDRSSEVEAKSLIALSGALAEVNRNEEALTMAQRAFLVSKSSGEAMRLRAARNLADRLAENGAHHDAMNVLSNELERAKGSVRELHPAQLEARESLMTLYAELGQVERAYQIGTSLLSDIDRVVPRTDPSSVRSHLNLANIKISVNPIGAAADFESLVALTEANYGQSHLLSLEAKLGLCRAFIESGHGTQAEGILDGVIEIASTHLGPSSAFVEQAGNLRSRQSA